MIAVGRGATLDGERGDGRAFLACDDEGVFPAPSTDVDVFVIDTTGGSAALALTTELRAAGVPVLLEPADQPWGERLAYVEDPEGNPVMICAPRE